MKKKHLLSYYHLFDYSYIISYLCIIDFNNDYNNDYNNWSTKDTEIFLIFLNQPVAINY